MADNLYMVYFDESDFLCVMDYLTWPQEAFCEVRPFCENFQNTHGISTLEGVKCR